MWTNKDHNVEIKYWQDKVDAYANRIDKLTSLMSRALDVLPREFNQFECLSNVESTFNLYICKLERAAEEKAELAELTAKVEKILVDRGLLKAEKKGK